MIQVSSSSTIAPGSPWFATPSSASTGSAAITRFHLHPHHTQASTSPSSSSTSRRKPKLTFRSPAATLPLTLKPQPRAHDLVQDRAASSALASAPETALSEPVATSPKSYSSSSSGSNYGAGSLPSTAPTSQSSSANSPLAASLRQTPTSTCSFFTPAPPLFKMPLAYPSYHPFSPSQLMLAAAARAEAALAKRNRAFGLSGSTADDVSAQGDDASSGSAGQHVLDENRRSSSRTRRPVAKLREGGAGSAGPESTSAGGAADGAGGESELTGTKSPKRKRNTGGAGSRKKRKEANAANAEPQPRRERQRRGAAAAAEKALAESAEALAAALDRNSVDASEVAGTPEPVPSVDESAGSEKASQKDEKETEDIPVSTRSASGRAPRAKRATRPRRSRITSAANVNDGDADTPARSTRSRRRGSVSVSGSDDTGSASGSGANAGAKAIIDEEPAAVEEASKNGELSLVAASKDLEAPAQDEDIQMEDVQAQGLEAETRDNSHASFTPEIGLQVASELVEDDTTSNIDPALLAEDAKAAEASSV